MADSKEAALFETAEEINDSALAPIKKEDRKPMIHEYEWTDYVLSRLDQEKDFITHNKQRFPKTDALYRILPQVLSVVILESSSHFVHRSECGVVTVEHTLLLESEQYQQKFVGLCDVSASNMDPPYSKYLAANGSTRARGRAIRDALMLRVCVAEELSKVAEEESAYELDNKLASHVQKSGIKNLCNRLNIDLNKFLQFGNTKYNSLDQVKYDHAASRFTELNKWQASPKDIPSALLKDS